MCSSLVRWALFLALHAGVFYAVAMVARRFATVAVAFCTLLKIPAAFSQQQLPGLEQLRLAAERGEPQAEHNFAEVFLGQGDYVNAFKWFQKAAGQGILDSQYRLGQMLLDG